MVRFPAVLGVLVLLAGCAGPGSPADSEAAPTADQGPETASPRLSRQGADEPGEPYSQVPVDPLSLTGITSFYWGLDASAVGLAIETVWDLGDENECSLMDAQRNGPGTGPSDLSIRQFEGGGYSWGLSGGGDLASAHLGPVDTRSASDGGGGGASRMTGMFSGELHWSWLLARVEPGDMPFLDGELAAGFAIECDDPFSLVSASTGPAAILVDHSNLAGGAGASVFLAGSANVGDAVSADIAAPTVHAACGSFGSHAGVVTARLPGGDQTWTHQPNFPVGLATNFFWADDGPGTYGFEVNRAGAYFEAFWCAAWGLDGPMDLNEGRRSRNPVDLPF